MLNDDTDMNGDEEMPATPVTPEAPAEGGEGDDGATSDDGVM